MFYKLSVIIPVYNSAQYVERCIRTLMEQTLDDIEYIIINDCTPDDAMHIVEAVVNDYPARKSGVRLINHKHNMGIAYTRQEGLDLATGEYITHCDSDDWLDYDYYENLYTLAKTNDSDMAVGNVIYEYGNRSLECNYPHYGDWNAFYKSSYIQLALWNRLVKRQFIIENDIDFYKDINFSEDYAFVLRCYYHSNNNVKCDKPSYYHYNKTNTSQITNRMNETPILKQKAKCLTLLSDFLKAHGVEPNACPSLMSEKRSVKEGCLLSSSIDFNFWKKVFPEVTPIIIKDRRLGLPYKSSWALGQYVHQIFMRCYLSLRK